MKKSIALLLGFLLAFAACRRDSPETQIQRAFSDCLKAIEASEASAATEVLHPQFQGPESMDRAAARLYLMGLFRREKAGITILRNELRVEGSKGYQQVELLLTSKTPSGLLPQEASRRIFQLLWKSEDHRWFLVELQTL